MSTPLARTQVSSTTPLDESTRLLAAVVCDNVAQPLSAVVAHKDVGCIERFFAAGFPVHVAIHRVDSAERQQRDYTELHSHKEAEINILIPAATGMTYAIRLGDELKELSGCASVYVPPYLAHSANVIEGSGYFITLRLQLDPGAASSTR